METFRCQCGNEILAVEKYDGENEIYLTKFYYSKGISILKRIKDAWTIIFNPHGFAMDDMIFNKEDANRLGYLLITMANKVEKDNKEIKNG